MSLGVGYESVCHKFESPYCLFQKKFEGYFLSNIVKFEILNVGSILIIINFYPADQYRHVSHITLNLFLISCKKNETIQNLGQQDHLTTSTRFLGEQMILLNKKPCQFIWTFPQHKCISRTLPTKRQRLCTTRSCDIILLVRILSI